MTGDREAAPDLALSGERVAFIGKLGGMNRKQAASLIREHGGVAVEPWDRHVSLVVIGADEVPLEDPEELLDEPLRELIGQGQCETLTETQLWQRLGLVEGESNVRRLYTPAMLAQLLEVSVSTIRRWHRRGLIAPIREVHRLPYFDFQEVAFARRIARLIASGTSPKAIENKLVSLAELVPGVSRPLAQLSVLVEGREVLLRQGEGLVEAGGQLRFDFDAVEIESDDEEDATVSFSAHTVLEQPQSLPLARQDRSARDELLEEASRLEEEGFLEESAEALRSWLISRGPKAEICFQLAEMLYRIGDLTAARERYFMAIELDEEYVEARANLGCLLAELGDFELALAAFRGALRYHPDYPDVHFHLGRTLDDLNRPDESLTYWHRFLELSPDSPWADEARQRLGLSMVAADDED